MSWRVPLESRTEEQFPPPLQGRIEWNRFESRVLEGNPWGDPTMRELPVYLPPSGKTEGRPLLVLLSGYTGSGPLHYRNRRFLTEPIVHRLDRMIRSGRIPEAVMVAPDCLTTLGGSQYLNSTATGRYEDYVVDEIVPWVRDRYRTGPCAVLGTSSGGYGALVLALRHPSLFPATGSNAGDAYFEYCYLPDFPVTFRELRREGGPEAFLRRIFTEPISNYSPAQPQLRALGTLAYASCYSPRDAEPGRFDLPFDLETSELVPGAWNRWLAQDPVRMIRTEPYRDALRRLTYVYVDGGRRDEYGLDLAARVFAAAARAAGGRVEFEDFDGVHQDGYPRYDVMVPRLLGALGFPAPSAPSRAI